MRLNTIQPLLSIIVTSYTTQRTRDILDLLDSITKQTYPNIETVFVIERSNELVTKITAYAKQIGLTNLKALFNTGEQGASAARNLGIQTAQGAIIAIIDDDVVLSPQWAQEIVKTYQQNPEVVGATGPCFPWWVDRSLAWFPEEFHWIISCTTWCDWQTIRDVRNVWLENASFKKEVFAQSGLLNTHLGPQDSVLGFKGRETTEGIISEEVEFSLRVKKQTSKRIVYNPQIKVWHKVYPFRLQLRYIAKWGFWTGQSKKHLKAANHSQADTIISSEYSLLKRILTGLFPKIFIQLFHKPKTALKRFSMSVFVLTSVFLGYVFG